MIGLFIFLAFVDNKTTNNTNDQKNNSSLSQDQPVTTKNQINISNLAFNPNSLTIKAGDTVVFKNSDPVAHTVTADNKEFDMPVNSNGSVSVTLDETGTVKYRCNNHPTMTGIVVVQ